MSINLQILLAVYNGEKFLPDALTSIVNQTNNKWFLLVRDDFSIDNSISIVNSLSAQYSNRVKLIDSGGKNLGVIGNYSELLSHASSDYLMLCDQDDIWLPHKIEVTMQEMHRLEGVFGKDVPLLVHTDAKVVDNNLNVVADSLWRYQCSDPVKGVSLNRLLTQNAVTGCTVMINRPLRDLALPIPPEAVMHDWWLALAAAAFGKIGSVPEATLLYRQHGENETGAQPLNLRIIAGWFARFREMQEVILRLQRQAAVFLDNYYERLSPQQRVLLEIYSRLHEYDFFRRRYYRLKYGYLYSGFIRNIGRLVVG